MSSLQDNAIGNQPDALPITHNLHFYGEHSPEPGRASRPLVSIIKCPSAQSLRGLEPDDFTRQAHESTPETPYRRQTRLQRHHGKLLPSFRVQWCGQKRAPAANAVVKCSRESKTCYLYGVMRCGSVWVCPVCAAKIANKRRAELSTAMLISKRSDIHVAHITATIPHGFGDDLDKLSEDMSSAWSAMHAGRNRTILGHDIGKIGTIRSFEITYGANGFHPHFHALLFHDGTQSLEEIERRYKARWDYQCQRLGLGKPSPIHGLTVQDGTKASDYVAKWGIESEMTQSHTKTGKSGSLTPWDLSRLSMEGGSDAERYAQLFRIYADATKGRRQLYWSNGLRERLGMLDELPDEQIAQEGATDDEIVHTFTATEFKAVNYLDLMPLVLHVATVQRDHLPGLVAGCVASFKRHINTS